jgi:hypothetical protein
MKIPYNQHIRGKLNSMYTTTSLKNQKTPRLRNIIHLTLLIDVKKDSNFPLHISEKMIYKDSRTIRCGTK